MSFHDDPVVDHILNSVNLALGEYRSEHERITGVEDVKLSEWVESLNAEEYDGDALELALDFIDSATAEQLAGFIPVLSELLTSAKQAQRKFYFQKQDRADTGDVDLEAMRDKAKKSYDNAISMAELGTFPGLTVDLIRALPNVIFTTRKVKNSEMTNEILDLPRAPSKDKKAWSGVRSTNSRLKLVIDGEVPSDHPENFGDALKRYGLGNVVSARPKFNEYQDRNQKVIFEENGHTYGLTERK